MFTFVFERKKKSDPTQPPPHFTTHKKKEKALQTQCFFLLSLLSDSNQRPRDYKSRALAN